jgi:hypothetical protein
LWAEKEKGQTLINQAFGNQLVKLYLKKVLLSGFDNFPRLDTSGTDLHSAIAASGQLNANRLQIRVKSPPGFVISV